MRLNSSKTLSLAAMQVPRSTLQDHVYEQLCALILDGEIAPGQLITIQSLSDAFGVSAMPIREALQKLIGAKALTAISGRSIGIPPLTVERLLDLTRVRLELEGAAAEWSVDHVSEPDIRQLDDLLGKMLRAVNNQDVKAFLRSNREFHFAIYKLSGSDAIYSIIEKLWLRIAPYFHHLYELDKYKNANIQHQRILQALKARDKIGVRQGIRADIETGSHLLLSMLPQAADDDGKRPVVPS